jgi:putative ABC transport system permease protein
MRSLLASTALAHWDLRGGLGGLWVALACLALGVAALAEVAGAGAAVQAGLAAEGRRLLGGDFEVATGARPMEA